MTEAPSNKLSHSAESSISVNCQLSDLKFRSVVFQNSSEDCPYLKSFRVALVHPWLYISLEWKTRPIYKQLKVFSKDGRSVTAEKADRNEMSLGMTTGRFATMDRSLNT